MKRKEISCNPEEQYILYEKPMTELEDSGTYGVSFKYDMDSGPADFEFKFIEVTVVP